MARQPKQPKVEGESAETIIDKAEEPAVEVVQAEPSQAAKAPDPAFLKLKEQLDAERAARIEADKRAAKAAETAHQAARNEESANLNFISSALETVKGNIFSLKAQLKDAYAQQDFDRIADITEAMSLQSARLSDLETGKRAQEERVKNPPRFEPPAQDPVENFISQIKGERSKAWIRSHPEYAKSPRLTQKMIAAHNLAVADGIDPETDEYFEHVEDTLKLRGAERAAVQADDEGTPIETFTEAAQGRPRESSPAAAPVSRNISPSGVNNSSRTVRLTKDQLEAARLSDMSPQEWYKQYMRGKQNGEITH